MYITWFAHTCWLIADSTAFEAIRKLFLWCYVYDSYQVMNMRTSSNTFSCSPKRLRSPWLLLMPRTVFPSTFVMPLTSLRCTLSRNRFVCWTLWPDQVSNLLNSTFLHFTLVSSPFPFLCCSPCWIGYCKLLGAGNVLFYCLCQSSCTLMMQYKYLIVVVAISHAMILNALLGNKSYGTMPEFSVSHNIFGLWV